MIGVRVHNLYFGGMVYTIMHFSDGTVESGWIRTISEDVEWYIEVYAD